MTDQATQTDDCAAMGAPVEQHGKMAPFAGTFKAEVKLWFGPGEPMVSTGVMTNTMELGGRFLQHDYIGDPCDGPFGEFKGRGFWGYNTQTNQYEGLWIDTACSSFQLEYGDVDASGKVWTMKGEMINPMNGEPLKKRTIVTLVDDDHHTMVSYQSGPDGLEYKAMEISYARA